MAPTPREQRLREAGFCIYCGSAEAPLTDEHCIPYALNGDIVLKSASCNSCQRWIGREIETPMLRGPLRSARIMCDMKSRNKPPRFIEVYRADKSWNPVLEPNKAKKLSIPIDEYPFWIALSTYSPPQLLDADAIVEGKVREGIWYGFLLKDRMPAFDAKYKLGEDQMLSFGRVSQSLTARFIAKIAHSTAIAALGFAAFKPLLREAVLSRDIVLIRRFVGGLLGPRPDGDSNLELDLSWWKCGDVEYLRCRIRLFSGIGGPEYNAFVGTRPTWTNEEQALAHWCSKPDVKEAERFALQDLTERFPESAPSKATWT